MSTEDRSPVGDGARENEAAWKTEGRTVQRSRSCRGETSVWSGQHAGLKLEEEHEADICGWTVVLTWGLRICGIPGWSSSKVLYFMTQFENLKRLASAWAWGEGSLRWLLTVWRVAGWWRNSDRDRWYQWQQKGRLNIDRRLTTVTKRRDRVFVLWRTKPAWCTMDVEEWVYII